MALLVKSNGITSMTALPSYMVNMTSNKQSRTKVTCAPLAGEKSRPQKDTTHTRDKKQQESNQKVHKRTATTCSNRKRTDSDILKRFEKARRRNQARRVQHHCQPSATKAPIIYEGWQRAPDKIKHYDLRDEVVFVELMYVRLRPSSQKQDKPVYSSPRATHHPAAQLHAKAARTFFKE